MDEDFDEEDGAPKRRTLSNAQVLGFIARLWMREPWLFTTTVVLILLAIGFDLMLPWAAKGVIDAVAQPPTGAVPWGAWGLFVGVYLGFALIRNLAMRFWIPLAARNMEQLVNEGFGRVQSFSADWHANNFAGATVRKLTRAMWGYDAVSDGTIVWLGPAMVVLVGLSVSMAFRWPLVGVFSMVIVAAYLFVVIWVTTKYVRPYNLRSNALDSRIGASLADAVTSNPAVKAFGAEEREDARFAQVTTAWRKSVIVTWNRFTDVWLLQNLLLCALQGGLSGLLIWFWSQGRATPGDVAFGITAFMLMGGYLRNLGENIRTLQKGLDDSEDVAAWMRQPPQVADRAGAGEFRPMRGDIVFDRVTFAYANTAEPLYDRFTLAIRAGERVALVGPTGAGKSTFVKLIQRLYDVQEGEVRIDGANIAEVTQTSLRQAIATVPQDPALFHRSIAENIAYARPDATPEEVRLAAKRARAHDFIERLPNGYETLVGERGVKLSGGERQRVAIARAFLADAPILVLDEATSSLDVETERQVQAAMEELMAGRTTIVIAHRLSTIRGADRILVFQGGRVVEEGRHGELTRKGGVYARLNAVAEGAA
jgi:ATP-binding cassette subfamily B protein